MAGFRGWWDARAHWRGCATRAGMRMAARCVQPLGRRRALGLSVDAGGVVLIGLERRHGGDVRVGLVRQAAPHALAALDVPLAWADVPLAMAVPLKSAMLRRQRCAPGLTEQEVELQVYAEACAAMPWAGDEVAVDFTWLGDIESTGEWELLTVAAHRERLRQQAEAVAAAGLRLTILEPETHAVWRAVARHGGEGARADAGPDEPSTTPPWGPDEVVITLEWRGLSLVLRAFNGLDVAIEREGAERPGWGDAQSVAWEAQRLLQFVRASSVRMHPRGLWLVGPHWSQAHAQAVNRLCDWPVYTPNLPIESGALRAADVPAPSARPASEDHGAAGTSAGLAAYGLALGALV